MKFWSILWRLFILVLALSLITGLAVNAAYGGNLNEQATLFKPTIVWGGIAALVWILSSASPAFLARLLFGAKFNLPQEAWLLVGRYTAGLFAILGLANIFVAEFAKLAPQLWQPFKLVAVPAGLPVLSFLLSRRLSHMDSKRANLLLNTDARQEPPRPG